MLWIGHTCFHMPILCLFVTGMMFQRLFTHFAEMAAMWDILGDDHYIMSSVVAYVMV